MTSLQPQHAWSSLPQHILVNVFTYLPYPDRARAARACRDWSQVFKSPNLWWHFNFRFTSPNHARSLSCAEHHGRYIKSVCIELDQSAEENRTNACKVLQILAKQTERRVKYLKITFCGENPCFYAGQEFMTELITIFKPPDPGIKLVHTLHDVDLSGLTISFTDDVINTLSANHPDLRCLNLQNRALVCRVTSQCVIRLVQRCRKLTDLRIFKCSACEDMLLALMENDRHPLKHLGLACRREEKYTKTIPDAAWEKLVQKLPALRVTLHFDHTCPLWKVSQVLQPHVPVQVLRLHTFTFIQDEVRQAASYYADTLETVVIETPGEHFNSPGLNDALIELATSCNKLNALHVYCKLKTDTIDKILALRPEMMSNRTYTLKDS